MNFTALLLLVATTAQATAIDCHVDVLPVASGVVRESLDAPLIEVVGGGYMDDESLLCLAKEVVSLRAEVATYEAVEAPAVTVPAIFIAAIALILGIGGGIAVAQALH